MFLVLIKYDLLVESSYISEERSRKEFCMGNSLSFRLSIQSKNKLVFHKNWNTHESNVKAITEWPVSQRLVRPNK